MKPKRKPIYCECGTKIGARQSGRVVIIARHHGQKHETEVPDSPSKGTSESADRDPG